MADNGKTCKLTSVIQAVATSHPMARSPSTHQKAINASSELLDIQHIGNLSENESPCLHL